MTEIVAVAISSLTTLLICLINNNREREKQNELFDKKISLLEYKLEELTKEVEKNNSVKERTSKLEGLAMLFDSKIQNVYDRLDKLEDK